MFTTIAGFELDDRYSVASASPESSRLIPCNLASSNHLAIKNDAGNEVPKKIHLSLTVAIAIVLFSTCIADNGAPQQISGDNRYTVVILGFEPKWKIRAIKSVREVTGLGLADAKMLVEQVPSVLKSGVHLAEAEAIKVQLKKSRLKVEIRATP